MNIQEYNRKAKMLDRDIERLREVVITNTERLTEKRAERNKLYMEGWDE